MRKRHEDFAQDRCYYAFVDLVPQHPETFIVPSSVVAKVLRADHHAWLAAPGLRGRPHQDNDMRRIEPHFKSEIPEAPTGWLDEYKERWDLIERHVPFL